MDVKKLIEAKEHCANDDCVGCPYEDNDKKCEESAKLIKLMDYYKALIKAERAAVIAEVREWAEKAIDDIDDESDHECGFRSAGLLLILKLDSMADKGDK